jgi:hypothetical protein
MVLVVSNVVILRGRLVRASYQIQVADEFRERLTALAAVEATPIGASLADLATQRANANLAAQRAQREAQAAKEEAEQQEAAREIQEELKAMEDQRRMVVGAGTSPGDRSVISRDSRSRLTVTGLEESGDSSEDSARIERFSDKIEIGDRQFNSVRLSCPQSGMFHAIVCTFCFVYPPPPPC